MFKSSPGLFKSPKAARIVAEGYSLEEGKPYVVLHKNMTKLNAEKGYTVTGKDGKDLVYFIPCAVEDLPVALAENWNELIEGTDKPKIG